MAFGRVNVLSKGGMEDIQTADYDGGDNYRLIDFTRQRKVTSNKIYDFNNNVITTLDGSFRSSHVGFIGTSSSLYELSTGNKTDFPADFNYYSPCFILNEDKDYLTERHGIRDKNGNLKHSLTYDSQFYSIIYIHNDVVYFQSISSSKRGIYKYENRKLTKIAEVPVSGTYKPLEQVNFL